MCAEEKASTACAPAVTSPPGMRSSSTLYSQPDQIPLSRLPCTITRGDLTAVARQAIIGPMLSGSTPTSVKCYRISSYLATSFAVVFFS